MRPPPVRIANNSAIPGRYVDRNYTYISDRILYIGKIISSGRKIKFRMKFLFRPAHFAWLLPLSDPIYVLHHIRITLRFLRRLRQNRITVSPTQQPNKHFIFIHRMEMFNIQSGSPLIAFNAAPPSDQPAPPLLAVDLGRAGKQSRGSGTRQRQILLGLVFSAPIAVTAKLAIDVSRGGRLVPGALTAG